MSQRLTISSIAVAAVLVVATACVDPPPGPTLGPFARIAPGPASEPSTGVPYGYPGAARRYASAKRLPLDRAVDTRAAYRAAERAASRLPRHSVALGGEIPAGLSVRARSELRGRWKPLGPGNIGGRTRTLQIDPENPDRMFLGGVSGGVWRTEDGGESWQPVGDGLENVAVNSMAMRPGGPDTLYVGTGEGYFREDVRGTGLPLRGGGIFRTRNGGESWTMLPGTGGEDFWFVNDLAVSDRGPERVYAATRTGVFRSLDGGDSWERILATGVQGGCLDLTLHGGNGGDRLLAACGTFEPSSVLRTENADAAADWETVLAEPEMGRTSLAVAPSDPEVVYALAASNVPGDYEQALHAVFRSDAGGAAGTWNARIRNDDPERHHTALLHNPFFLVRGGCDGGPEQAIPMGWYVNVIAVDPVDPDVVWAAGVDWFRSDDGGRSWGPASYWWAGGRPAGAHADQHVITFHPDYDGAGNQSVYIGNDGGIYRSDNARADVDTGSRGLCSDDRTDVVWEPLNHGLEITQFYHGLPLPDGRRQIGGTQDNGTLGKWPCGRECWFGMFGGDGGYVAVDPVDPDVIYAGYQFGSLIKSVDGGRTFTDARRGLPPAREGFLEDVSRFLFVTPLVMDPSDRLTLWTGGREIYRTDDGAGSWQRASRRLRGRSRASAIAVSPVDRDRVVVGTDRGFVFVTDRGTTAGSRTRWPLRRPRKAWVTSVAFDPVDPDVLYATYGGFGGPHVYRSDDGGRRWRSIDGTGAAALPDIPVHSIVVDPDAPERLFLGTDLGVFVSSSGGRRWAREIAGFGRIVTEWLVLQREGRRTFLYAFTHGRSAWRSRVKPPR